MIERDTLLARAAQWLQPDSFQDHAPNGLQVQGRARVRHLASAVTASRDAIAAAVAAGADSLIVHHGLFWRGMSPCVTGWMRQRLALLLAHDINLIAYHLPLDAHPELGNNAQWAARMGWQRSGSFGPQQLGCLGARADGAVYADAAALARHLEQVLKHPVSLIQPALTAIESIAWCSGGAQSYFEAAIAAGAQAFVTGEISEPQAHLARECGVAYLACGHHASERWGAPALAQALADTWGLRHTSIDIDNPA